MNLSYLLFQGSCSVQSKISICLDQGYISRSQGCERSQLEVGKSRWYYSGTSLIQTQLRPSPTVRIIEVSSLIFRGTPSIQLGEWWLCIHVIQSTDPWPPMQYMWKLLFCRFLMYMYMYVYIYIASIFSPQLTSFMIGPWVHYESVRLKVKLWDAVRTCNCVHCME